MEDYNLNDRGFKISVLKKQQLNKIKENTGN